MGRNNCILECGMAVANENEPLRKRDYDLSLEELSFAFSQEERVPKSLAKMTWY